MDSAIRPAIDSTRRPAVLSTAPSARPAPSMLDVVEFVPWVTKDAAMFERSARSRFAEGGLLRSMAEGRAEHLIDRPHWQLGSLFGCSLFDAPTMDLGLFISLAQGDVRASAIANLWLAIFNTRYVGGDWRWRAHGSRFALLRAANSIHPFPSRPAPVPKPLQDSPSYCSSNSIPPLATQAASSLWPVYTQVGISRTDASRADALPLHPSPTCSC